MAKTTVFTKPGCPYCAAALADFSNRGIDFEQVDVQADLAARERMRKLSGTLRVPTIVNADGTVSVGFGGF